MANTKSFHKRVRGYRAVGFNIKRNGERREWDACLTGFLMKGKQGEMMIQVEEIKLQGIAERWLNLSTFTGFIEKTYFEQGSVIEV